MSRIVTTFFLILLATNAHARQFATTVAAYNRAPVAAGTLGQAEKLAQYTLLGAMVEVVRLDCPEDASSARGDCGYVSDISTRQGRGINLLIVGALLFSVFLCGLTMAKTEEQTAVNSINVPSTLPAKNAEKYAGLAMDASAPALGQRTRV